MSVFGTLARILFRDPGTWESRPAWGPDMRSALHTRSPTTHRPRRKHCLIGNLPWQIKLDAQHGTPCVTPARFLFFRKLLTPERVWPWRVSFDFTICIRVRVPPQRLMPQHFVNSRNTILNLHKRRGTRKTKRAWRKCRLTTMRRKGNTFAFEHYA